MRLPIERCLRVTLVFRNGRRHTFTAADFQTWERGDDIAKAEWDDIRGPLFYWRMGDVSFILRRRWLRLRRPW